MPTRQITIRDVRIGGGAPVSIQSMCNTDTCDAAATLKQIEECAQLGCQIIRIALPRKEAVDSFRQICAASPLPVIADIHFDGNLALAALDCADGIRINPGNIRNMGILQEIAEKAASLEKVVRIGVNMGSLSPEMENKYGRTTEAMVASAQEYCRLFEDWGCRNLKVSLKSSDLRMTIDAARRFATVSDIPQHIGITESGLPTNGVIKSAIGIGALLLDGIGDTLRVSLTANPVEEVVAAKRILRALGMLNDGYPELISCPTCGRTRIDLAGLAAKVEREIDKIYASGKTLNCKKIAIMGCEVNGPGEAADADIGIAGGNGRGLIFKHGKAVAAYPEEELLDKFLEELK